MPVQLDPSLIGSGNSGINAFQNAFSNGLKIRAMQQENDINDYKMQESQAESGRQNALANLLSQQNFNPASAEGQAQMYGAGGVKSTQSFLKNQSDIAETGAKAGKELASTRKIDLENHLQKFDIMDRLMSPVRDQAGYDAMKVQALQNPLLADMVQHMPLAYDPVAIEAGRRQAMSKKDEIAAELAQKIANETGRHNLATEGNAATGNQITMRGQDITARGQNMTDARARESSNKGHYDADRGMMISPQGVATPVMSGGVPLGAKDAKPTGDYLKQAEAYQNMDDALTGYKKSLQGFGMMDMVNPSKRAEMGQAYQNTLLQAKEIYKLGVLNGGDERILKGIISSPLDVTNIVMPTEAMIKQADDLQAIVRRNNENLAKVNKQPTMPLNSQPSQVTDAASYAKLPSGATYVAPNGKTYTKK